MIKQKPTNTKGGGRSRTSAFLSAIPKRRPKCWQNLTGGTLWLGPAQPYSADYQACIAEAKADLQKNTRPAVRNLSADPDAYDEIYLGYPNHWGTMPKAVYTFLENYDFTGKTIHSFCPHEGSGLFAV